MNQIVGSLLIIMVTGEAQLYVAEVVQESPLYLKISEDGKSSRLKPGDYIINEELTKRVQGTEAEQQELLREMVANGTPLASGLKSVGVESGKIERLNPIEEQPA